MWMRGGMQVGGGNRAPEHTVDDHGNLSRLLLQRSAFHLLLQHPSESDADHKQDNQAQEREANEQRTASDCAGNPHSHHARLLFLQSPAYDFGLRSVLTYALTGAMSAYTLVRMEHLFPSL